MRFLVWLGRIVVLAALALPIQLRAAGPTVVVDLDFHSVEIQPGDQRNIIQYSDDVKDLQAVRVERDNIYYAVVLRWKGNIARLYVYDKNANQIASRKVFKAKGDKDLTVVRLMVVAANDEEVAQVEAIKTNDTGQPIKVLRKQYAVLPSVDSVLPLRDFTQTAITYPDFSGMSDPTAGLALINYQREAAGVFGVERSSTLDSKCSLHAEYMRLNDELTHDEDDTQPGYTANGAEAGYASLVTKQTSGSMVQSTDILMKAIYHRLQLLDNYIQVIGYAISGTSASGFRYGCLYLDTKSNASGEIAGADNNITYADFSNHAPILSPGPNQVNVINIFYTGEDPDPLTPFGGDIPAGYPISVTFPSTYDITNISMTLLHPNGQPLAGYFRAPDDPSDPNLIYQGNSATFIPEAPLATGTTYTMQVSADYNNQTYTQAWQFTTE